MAPNILHSIWALLDRAQLLTGFFLCSMIIFNHNMNKKYYLQSTLFWSRQVIDQSINQAFSDHFDQSCNFDLKAEPYLADKILSILEFLLQMLLESLDLRSMRKMLLLLNLEWALMRSC